jgi:hypothetical protein
MGKKSKMECPVCLDLMGSGQEKVLSCVHSVCETCLPEVLIAGNCPLCRKDVSPVVGTIGPPVKFTPPEFSMTILEPTDPKIDALILKYQSEVQKYKKEVEIYTEECQKYQERIERMKALAQRGYNPESFNLTPPVAPRKRSFYTTRDKELAVYDLRPVGDFKLTEPTDLLTQEQIEAVKKEIEPSFGFDTEKKKITNILTKRVYDWPYGYKRRDWSFYMTDSIIFAFNGHNLHVLELVEEQIVTTRRIILPFNENDCQIVVLNDEKAMVLQYSFFEIFSLTTGSILQRVDTDFGSFQRARLFDDGKLVVVNLVEDEEKEETFEKVYVFD